MKNNSPRLWNRNFTIITLGSVVSMMGNTVAGFAISLMVLDYTDSTMLYTLYIVCYNLPKLIMPLLAGPWLDAFSRRKAIYLLDYISSGIYLMVFLLLRANMFSYLPFLLICMLIGAIDSVYLVAYDSLYPNLVDKANYRKAYSISSVLTTLSMVVAPLAMYAYELAGGAAPLFLFNAVTFFLAATMETQIRVDESHIKSGVQRFSLGKYKADFKSGLDYIRGEPGLLVITAYFFFNCIAQGADTLALPYFKATAHLGVMAYMYTMLGALIGRAIGGSLHYRHKLPTDKKFAIAFVVYIALSITRGTYLFLPSTLMMSMFFFVQGLLGVTSYNIRISGTQSYVPDSHRARFNGTYQMIINLGSIIGQLTAGALGEFISIPMVFVGMAVLQLVAIMLTMGLKGKHVKPIYNVDV